MNQILALGADFWTMFWAMTGGLLVAFGFPANNIPAQNHLAFAVQGRRINHHEK
jgi:hypothetical protein